MSAMRVFAEVVRTSVTDLARRPLASLLSIAAMAVALFVLASFLTLRHGVERAFLAVSRQAVIEIFLREGAEDTAVTALEARLARSAAVERVERISPDLALSEFKALFPDLEDVEGLLGGNPFPGSLRVLPRSPDRAVIEAVADLARDDPSVESVRYDREWIEGLARIGEALSSLGMTGTAVLVLAALVTIASVVRLTLDDKRDEVLLMRLVGASNVFVTGPVLISGMLLGAAGGAAGVLAAGAAQNAAIAKLVDTPVLGLASLVLRGALSPVEIGCLVAAGALGGTLAALFAAGRSVWR